MSIYNKLLVPLAAFLLISTLPVACVNTQQAKKGADQNKQELPVNSRLEPRISARWDAMIGREFEQVYSYFSPAYRKLFSIDHFLKDTGSSVGWRSSKIKDIQFEGNRAAVTITVGYNLILPGGVGREFGELYKDLKEVWVWTEGDWWYVRINEGGLK